jgi:hypothetical protein
VRRFQLGPSAESRIVSASNCGALAPHALCLSQLCEAQPLQRRLLFVAGAMIRNTMNLPPCSVSMRRG